MRVHPIEQQRIIGIETEYGMWPHPPSFELTQQHINANLPDYLHTVYNGFNEYGRIYKDFGDSLEVSTSEVYTLGGLLAVHFAGEDLARDIVKGIMKGKSHLQKTSLDGKWHSRGEHENFMVGGDFGDIELAKLAPFLAIRPVLTGPGTVYRPRPRDPYRYAIDARTLVVDGTMPIAGGSTKAQKPLMKSMSASGDVDPSSNTRRVQVVSGSMNMYAFPVAARMFGTSAVLRLIEHDMYPDELLMRRLSKVVGDIPQDVTATAKVETLHGKQYSAVEFLMELLGKTLKLDLPKDEKTIVTLSAEKLAAIEDGNLDACRGYIEWMDKLDLLEGHAAKNGYRPMTAESAQLNIRWHERRTDGKLSVIERLRCAGRVALNPDDESKERAKRMPPDQTRAQERSQYIAEAVARDQKMEFTHWNRWKAINDPHTIVRNNAWADFDPLMAA